MAIVKSYQEINEKISSGKAVVITASEFKAMAAELSPSELVKKADVVTTATFGAMCSSGVFLNFGHTQPPIKMKRIWLNGVQAYGGIAAVDAYLGAAETSENDPTYGGAHVIEDLIAGKSINFHAIGTPTDCYPRREVQTTINKESINEAIMFNPRNAYQNYNVAINTTNKIKHTYMGTLLPNIGNANYSTAGEISPLLNDPYLRTIGIGTRIFIGGAHGYVAWNGTQFTTSKPFNDADIPIGNSATLSLIGNLKEMDIAYIKAAYFEKYGVSLFMGIGIPIPVLDEEMAHYLSITNDKIETNILDYGKHPIEAVGRTNYRALQSGIIIIDNKKVKTAPVASLHKAQIIAIELKNRILDKRFFLSEPVELFKKSPLPKPLN